MQVPQLSVTFMGINTLLGIVIPVVMYLLIRKKTGAKPSAFWIGCGSFLLFAMVLESIVHNVVLSQPFGQVILNNVWLYALYGGLMAGLFEETGRLLAMRFLRRKSLHPSTALMYGAGHGGVEVVLVLCVTMIQNIAYVMMINSGSVTEVLAALGPEDQQVLGQIVQTLVTTSPFAYLLGLAERLVAVVSHLSLSIIVWQAAVKPGKKAYFFLAIALHACVDGFAVVLSRAGLPEILVELVLVVAAGALGCFAWKLYRADEQRFAE